MSNVKKKSMDRKSILILDSSPGLEPRFTFNLTFRLVCKRLETTMSVKKVVRLLTLGVIRNCRCVYHTVNITILRP